MLGRVAVGARDEHAPLRLVGERRPHLLAGHDPVVAVAHGARLHRRQVGAGLGLGEALAPDLLGGEDRLQVALLLLLGAVRDDRRPAHGQAEHVGELGRPRAHDLLVEDRLLDQRGAAAAVLLRPGEPRPAGLVQRRAANRAGTRRPPRRPRAPCPGWFASSHERSSSRKASSSGARVKSTAADPSGADARCIASTLGRMRIGLFLAYWPWFSLEEQVELAVARRRARARLGVDLRGLGPGRGLGARAAGREDRADRARLGADADPRPPARGDRDGRGLARRDLRRALPARPRRVRTAGLRGLVRRAVRQAARAHARVRRDRAQGAGARAARAPRRGLHAAARRGARRRRARQAAQAAGQARPGADPDLPRRDRAEGARADRRDRRRLAAVPVQPGRARDHARAAAPRRRARRALAGRHRRRARRPGRGRRRPRRGARRHGQAVAGLLPRRHGREGRRTSTSSWPSATGTATSARDVPGARAGRRPRGRGRGDQRRADRRRRDRCTPDELADRAGGLRGGGRGHARRRPDRRQGRGRARAGAAATVAGGQAVG